MDYGIFYNNAAPTELSNPFCDLHRRRVVGGPANHNFLAVGDDVNRRATAALKGIGSLCRTYGAWCILGGDFY